MTSRKKSAATATDRATAPQPRQFPWWATAWLLGFVSVLLLVLWSFGTFVPHVVKDGNGYTPADYDAAYRAIGENFTHAVSTFEDRCRETNDELASVTFEFLDGDIVSGHASCTRPTMEAQDADPLMHPVLPSG